MGHSLTLTRATAAQHARHARASLAARPPARRMKRASVARPGAPAMATASSSRSSCWPASSAPYVFTYSGSSKSVLNLCGYGLAPAARAACGPATPPQHRLHHRRAHAGGPRARRPPTLSSSRRNANRLRTHMPAVPAVCARPRCPTPQELPPRSALPADAGCKVGAPRSNRSWPCPAAGRWGTARGARLQLAEASLVVLVGVQLIRLVLQHGALGSGLVGLRGSRCGLRGLPHSRRTFFFSFSRREGGWSMRARSGKQEVCSSAGPPGGTLQECTALFGRAAARWPPLSPASRRLQQRVLAGGVRMH